MSGDVGPAADPDGVRDGASGVARGATPNAARRVATGTARGAAVGSRALARLVLPLAGVLLIAFAVLTLGARLLLPLVENREAEIEARLGDYLGQPVEIGELDLRWGARGPELRLLDVAVSESDTRRVTFAELLVDVDLLGSALHGAPLIDELTLSGADLSIEYSGDGRFRLHGVEPSMGAAVGTAPDAAEEGDARADAATGARGGSDAGLDVAGWLLDARRVGLLDTRVTLIDARDGRRLVIDELNVRAENDDESHRLRVTLALPPELGGSLEAGIDLRGSSDRLAVSDGSLYVRGSDLQLAALRDLRRGLPAAAGSVPPSSPPLAPASDALSAPDTASTGGSPDAPSVDAPATPADLADALLSALNGLDADARVEVWGDWEDGEMRRARARLDVNALTLDADAGGERDTVSGDESGGADAERLLDSLSADLVYRDEQPGWTLEADRVELALGAERAVIGNVEIGRGARDERHWRIAAGGERLPLSLAARLPAALLARLPGPAPRSLATLQPGGALVDWRARLTLEDAVPRLSFSGELEALSLAAAPSRPGVAALDGTIAIDDNRGTFALTGKSFALERGEDTLEVDALDVALDIDARIPGQARVDGRATLTEASLAARLRFGLTFASGRSPYIDAQGRYTVGDVADVSPWLPIAGAPEPLARWLRRALLGGRAEGGELVWVGPVAGFPYAADPDEGANANAKADEGRDRAAPDGVFRAGVDIVDGELEFLPGWPRARLSTARVELDGMTLVARTARGSLESFEATRAVARIADLRRAVLRFETSGHDELQSLVDFANEGPLANILRPALERASGTGRAGLDLALGVPLYRRGGALDVDGSLFLDGNDLTFGRADLTLVGARGAIGFDEGGVRIANLRATLFDRPVSIDGASSGRGGEALTEIELGGALEAADVLSHYGIPLDRFVSGASRWSVVLSAPHSAAKMRRDGVRLLARSDLVGTRLALPAPLDKPSAHAVPLTLSTAFRDGATTTRWRIEHGARLLAAVDVDEAGLHSLGARFGEGPVEPPAERGIRLDGHAPRLAFDGWARAIATLLEDLPATEETPEPILPIAATLSTDALVAGVRSLGAATLRVSSDADYLNAVVDNPHLAGSVRYPREHWRRERTMKVRVRHVDRAFVDALDSAPESAATSASLDPRRLPAIEAYVGELVWDDLTLEALVLDALPTPLGLTFEVRTSLAGATTLAGGGAWRLRDADVVDATRAGLHRSELSIELAGESLGAGLASAGLPGVLAEGRGRVSSTLAWSGPLYLPTLERSTGTLSLDIARGRIVPLEPGPARLVGLFALQAIPRRLSFDFRDVTSDGLAFERVTGEVAFGGGVADVSLVQLTGPIGVVDVTGTSNLVTREYDQRITVLPRVSAALPIIGLLSAGASGGIGALVAGGFLKALGLDLDRIGLRRYALRGSWDEPVLDPLGGQPRRSP